MLFDDFFRYFPFIRRELINTFQSDFHFGRSAIRIRESHSQKRFFNIALLYIVFRCIGHEIDYTQSRWAQRDASYKQSGSNSLISWFLFREIYRLNIYGKLSQKKKGRRNRHLKCKYYLVSAHLGYNVLT